MFLVSAFQVRAVPFFAIAAGPALALNVQEFLARQSGAWFKSAEARRWAVAGRAVTLLAGLALLVVAWPGWLHAPPFEPPRWTIEADLGLRRTAEQVAQWRRDGALGPTDVGFNLSADAANYFAWFCPEEKGVVDSRPTLVPPEAAADFVAIRRAMSDPGEPMTYAEAQAQFVAEILAPEDAADPERFGGPPMEAVREVLRKRKADHLIVYDNDRSTAFSWVERLQRFPREWPLLYLGGHAAVFAWRNPKAPDADPLPRLPPIDWDRMAFDPPDDWKAPRTGPDREPAAADWTDPFLRSRTPKTALADEAGLYLQRFDQAAGPYSYRTVSAWQRSLAAAVVGAASCANGSVLAPSTMALPWDVLTGPALLPKDAKPTPADEFLFWCRSDFQARHDDGPVGFLYLALRAARRAIRTDPDDARAYLVLGEAYLRLLTRTAERGLPAAGLLEHTDRGRPSFLPRPHRPGDHRLHASPPAQPRPAGRPHRPAHLVSRPELPGFGAQGVSGGAALQSRGRRQARRGPKAVQRARPRLGRPGRGQGKGGQGPAGSVRGGVGRAAGVRSGRPGAPEVRPGRQGAFHPFTLGSGRFRPGGRGSGAGAVPDTGRLHEARTWPQKDVAMDYLGPLPFLAIQVQLAAASGNYDEADADLAKMIDATLGPGGQGIDAIPPRTSMIVAVMQALLEAEPQDGNQAYLIRTGLFFPEILVKMQQMAAGIREEANLTTLRGALALESGEVKPAEQLFHDALSVWGDDARAASGAGLDFEARFLAEAGKNALKRAGYLTPKLWEQ